MHRNHKKQDISGLRDRYMRINTLIKYGLAGVVACVLVVAVVWSYFGEKDSIAPVADPSIASENEVTEKRKILNPQYLSTDKKDRPFKVSAEFGEQISDDEVFLSKPRVDFVLQNGTVGILTANKGEINQENQTLVIEENVVLEHQSGHKMVTKRAQVDMETRMAWSDTPVSGDGPMGTFVAKGFRIKYEGETIIFTGPGRLVVSLAKAQDLRKAGQ